GALGLVCEFGTEDQRATYVDKMLTGEWAGTMCLTEANAGTAVPDLRSTATPIEGRPGYFKIKGQKIFISSGDHDLTENIVHMVLARVPGDEGISLFIVPRLRPTRDGGLEYNDVVTMGIEEKLGIHASPTTSLAFGDEDDCEGWLIGEQGKGLRCMFKMMNEARIAVGIQGVGLSNKSYQLSVRYAKERIQGTRIQDMRKKDAPRVAIIEHPDVRRMLMYMKAVGEGSRALAYYASYCQDMSNIATDEAEKKRWTHQVDLLVPIVKAWCSDEGFRSSEYGVQVHGGYGYVREYGVEQILRDAKIASIYEGTNGVQALDLVGRKVAKGGGVMLMTMLNEMNQFINGPAKEGAFADEITALGKARDAVAKTAMGFGQRMMKGDIEYAALHATPFLQMFGDLVIAWLLLRQATTAQKLYDARMQKLEAKEGSGEPGREGDEFGQILQDDDEARFLHGKMQTAQFFVHQILPRVRARLASVDSQDRSALQVIL
ncbi:MAG: acyl-CoA dehydrogenase, partial [Myxococcota bacterium]